MHDGGFKRRIDRPAWALDMESLTLGWYVLVETGSIVLLLIAAIAVVWRAKLVARLAIGSRR